jgi:dinuclear metal center YbgI/SA1388 family protein
MIIKKIVNFLNSRIDQNLAYNWDNPGLQIGSLDWNVKKIFLTLDVNDISVEQAIKINADLIISHHPYIFRPINNVTDSLTLKLIEHKIGVFSAHTNLDVISGGVNSVLADLFGLTNRKFIDSNIDADFYFASFYLPQNLYHKASLIIEKNGGKLLQKQIFAQNDANLVKVEFSSDSFKMNKIVGEIRNFHPDKKVDVQIYKQQKNNPKYGLGIQGKLEKPLTLMDFVEVVKRKLGVPKINLWLGDKKENDLIENIAVCGGTGASLLSKLGKNIECFVSSDFTYHTILDSKIPLIDAGHLYTEYPVLDYLEKILAGFEVEIIKSSLAEQKYSQKIRFL